MYITKLQLLISFVLLQLLPSGDWHCPNCTCKFCGSASEYAAEENNSTGNELEQCHFCEKKCNSFMDLGFSLQHLSFSLSFSLRLFVFKFQCDYAEIFYLYFHIDHKSCSERAQKLGWISNDASFCGPKCQEVLITG